MTADDRILQCAVQGTVESDLPADFDSVGSELLFDFWNGA